MNKDEQKIRHQKWQALIKEHETSGLSQTQFCKERNISSAQFGYYRNILKSNPSQIGNFTPVTIKSPAISADMRITFPNGFQCIFPSDLNPSQVKEWIRMLLSC
jgi:hypothetical protein